jgi:hypothetical protein
MNISNRQQLLALLAGAAVALWAGDRMVFSPLIQSWKERAERITELKKSVTQGAMLLEREWSIRARWEMMRTNSLPGEMSLAEDMLLSAFDRWSQASRISVTSVRPQWKRSGEDFATLECRVDASGNLGALTRFLYDLEHDPLGIKVDIVELTSRDPRGAQLALGLQVSALMFTFPLVP